MKYQYSSEPTGIHRIIIDHCAEGAKVLDVGCASGYFGRALKVKKCSIIGIEPEKVAAEAAIATGCYDYILVGGVEEALAEGSRLAQEMFDIIICADVLEHLNDPEEVLRRLKGRLRPGGRLIVSLPNVAHYSVRFGLLRGKFDATETGILDRTHLHFYTLASAEQLLLSSGWEIAAARPRGDLERWLRKIRLEPLGRWLLFRFSRLFAVQYIFILK